MAMTNADDNNIFLRMHPMQRIIVSILISTAAYFIIPSSVSKLITLILLWDIFSISYLIISFIVIKKRTIVSIRKWAQRDDGSLAFVFFLIVTASFASMITVLLLMLSQKNASSTETLYLPVVAASIFLSWIMVHTIFTFHYAHMYYDADDTDPEKDAYGLEFPDKDPKPDYIDFAYFSFVIGCTFQVSDIEISSSRIRRVVLFHSLLSFCLNTFVVALTINLIAGLSK
jgi:uncharacterized membrane protein